MTDLRRSPVLSGGHKWSSAHRERDRLLADLGLGRHTRIGLGVDRLGDTKIEMHLEAVERFFHCYPEWRGRFTFVQLVSPGQIATDASEDNRRRVETIGSRIATRYGHGRSAPVILKFDNHGPATVRRYYRGADVCVVTDVWDGANLVAREFVDARDDLAGVLILGGFGTVAWGLDEALIINPRDLDQMAEALSRGLAMPAVEQEMRMRSLRRAAKP